MENRVIADISVEMFNTIDDIKSTLWDSLAAEDDLSSSHSFLQAVEKSNFSGYSFKYLMFFQQEKLVATATLFSTHVNAELLTTGKLRSFIHIVSRIFTSLFVFKVLFCGLPVSIGKNNIRIADGADKSALLALLWRKMVEIAHADQIKMLVFKEFNAEEIIDYDELTQFGFCRVDSLPTNEMTIRWNSYKDYLHALRHRYRESILRSQKKIGKSEITIRVHRNFCDAYSDDIYRLYENVIENAEFRFEKLPCQFFINVGKYFKEESELIVVRRREKPIGKVLMMYSPNKAIAMFLGIDYDFNREYDLYFNMLTEIIRRTIEKKRKKLEFGQNSYQAKGRMGAKPTPLYLYIMHLNKFWNFFIHRSSSILFRKVGISPHSVFKTELIKET